MNNVLIYSLFLSLFGVFNVLGINQSLFIRQFFFIFVAATTYIVIKKIGRQFFRRNTFFFYIIFIVLLIVTYIVGLEVKGSKRWINLYFFNFQASEVLKIFFILFFASLLSKAKYSDNKLVVFLSALMYFLVPFVIIFKQPDLGNAMVYGFIFLIMILFSNLPKKYLINMLIVAALMFPLGWFILKPYQQQRILSYFNPQVDQQGTAYNMIQAMITIGSGRFLGRGLGLGTQSKLFFLPENHTDFAFSSLVEQFGFLGGSVVIGLFVAMVIYLIKRTFKYFYQRNEEGEENFLYLVGFVAYFIFQVFVNLGMNMGILPVAGIALPFISYGGSSIGALMIGIALIP